MAQVRTTRFLLVGGVAGPFTGGEVVVPAGTRWLVKQLHFTREGVGAGAVALERGNIPGSFYAPVVRANLALATAEVNLPCYFVLDAGERLRLAVTAAATSLMSVTSGIALQLL